MNESPPPYEYAKNMFNCRYKNAKIFGIASISAAFMLLTTLLLSSLRFVKDDSIALNKDIQIFHGQTYLTFPFSYESTNIVIKNKFMPLDGCQGNDIIWIEYDMTPQFCMFDEGFEYKIQALLQFVLCISKDSMKSLKTITVKKIPNFSQTDLETVKKYALKYIKYKDCFPYDNFYYEALKIISE